MREGIPAVVAMQYEITDTAALAFAAGFYEALARGKPVDQAVTKGQGDPQRHPEQPGVGDAGAVPVGMGAT